MQAGPRKTWCQELHTQPPNWTPTCPITQFPLSPGPCDLLSPLFPAQLSAEQVFLVPLKNGPNIAAQNVFLFPQCSVQVPTDWLLTSKSISNFLGDGIWLSPHPAPVISVGPLRRGCGCLLSEEW